MSSLRILPDGYDDADNICSTFLKRKGGLFKKAHELSVLCSVDVAVIIFGNNKKLYEYSSGDMQDIMTRYNYVRALEMVVGIYANVTIVWRGERTQRPGRLQRKRQDG